MIRRDFLKQSVALGMTPFLMPGFSMRDESGCHAFFRGEQLLVFRNHKLMLDYRFHSERKHPCFGQLTGPVSGLSLTSNDAQPWDHGRSMFFSCDRVNGNDFRRASQSGGKIVTSEVLLKSCAQDAVEFTHLCYWLDRKNRSLMKDERCFSVRFPSENVYTIDCSFTMTPLVDITIAPTGHSFLGLKTASDIAPDGGGTLRNSSGLEGMKNTFGKNAKWCTCFGRRRGIPNHPIEGIALLVPDTSQESMLEQSCWLTRDYGFLVPNSFHFLKKPWTRQGGKTFTLRYRVVAYSGEPNDDLLDTFGFGPSPRCNTSGTKSAALVLAYASGSE